jgi:hypothetical protein
VAVAHGRAPGRSKPPVISYAFRYVLLMQPHHAVPDEKYATLP